MYDLKVFLPPLFSLARPSSLQYRAAMAYQGRLPTLLLTFILCFSPCPTSGDKSLNHCPECSYGCPIKYYTSTYGAECSDACEDRGSGYYWCNTQKGWDYCSPSNNVDYKGNICHKDYTCSREGQNYYWCYLEKGGWGYCAQMLPKTMTHYTRYQEECINPCQYQKNGDYYWCYTKDSWSYCSPQADFTYKFKSCRPDHNCGTHGQNYTWCYITDDDWDYCGLSHFDACMQTEQDR